MLRRHTGVCRAAAGREPSKKKAAAKPAAKDEMERNPRSREQVRPRRLGVYA